MSFYMDLVIKRFEDIIDILLYPCSMVIGQGIENYTLSR